MATIKNDEGDYKPEVIEQTSQYICGVDFAEHGSGDISIYCVMSFGIDGLITIVEMTKVPPFSQFAMERLKQIEELQKEIFIKYPGVKFIKESK